MTQQFKFGDPVIYSGRYGIKNAIVVSLGFIEHDLYEIYAENDGNFFVLSNEIKLNIHSDTARLNWIESQQGFKESILKLSDGSHTDFSIRELIDNAMKEME